MRVRNVWTAMRLLTRISYPLRWNRIAVLGRAKRAKEILPTSQGAPPGYQGAEPLGWFAVGVCAGAATLALAGVGCGQAPPPAAPAQAASVHGDLAQVMRGIVYPASNVIFAAQGTDPATVKPEADPSTSPNPLTSSYGGWMAVENAGISLAEAANLLTVPGRLCMNGKPVPIQNADWQMWVQGLRDAGMASYKAAQAKSQDAILEASDLMSTACQNCHDKYREVPGGVADRCQ